MFNVDFSPVCTRALNLSERQKWVPVQISFMLTLGIGILSTDKIGYGVLILA